MNQFFIKFRRRPRSVPIPYPDPISRHFSGPYRVPARTNDLMAWVIIFGLVALLCVMFPIDFNAVFGWR